MKKLLAVLVLLAFVTPALADDLNPPDYRGDPLSYQAEWDLFTNGTFGTGIYTDYENSVDDYNDPGTYLHTGFGTHLDFDPGPGWAMALQGGGIYNPQRDATFAANVVNWIDWEPWKKLRIQVTYTDGGFGAPAITDVFGYAPITGGEPYASALVDVQLTPPSYFYEDWIIVPNPDWEQIVFFVPMGTIVEQLVIDTVSPEPASMSLLALGAVAVLRRRKK